MGWADGEADDDDAGRYTSVFPRLGVVIRYSIPPLAADSEGQLVRIDLAEG